MKHEESRKWESVFFEKNRILLFRCGNRLALAMHWQQHTPIQIHNSDQNSRHTKIYHGKIKITSDLKRVIRLLMPKKKFWTRLDYWRKTNRIEDIVWVNTPYSTNNLNLCGKCKYYKQVYILKVACRPYSTIRDANNHPTRWKGANSRNAGIRTKRDLDLLSLLSKKVQLKCKWWRATNKQLEVAAYVSILESG